VNNHPLLKLKFLLGLLEQSLCFIKVLQLNQVVLNSFVLKLMAKFKTQHAFGAAIEVTRLIFCVFLLARVVFRFIRNCPPAKITLSL
jgi:hypothetical protein